MAQAMESWAAMEFKGIDLGDKRLNRRAVLLAEQLAGNPTASIPQACCGWAETAAAYRFFGQDKLEWTDLMEPHWQCTAERMRACDVVLNLADTTGLDFNGQEIGGFVQQGTRPFGCRRNYAVLTHRNLEVAERGDQSHHAQSVGLTTKRTAPTTRTDYREQDRLLLKHAIFPSSGRTAPLTGQATIFARARAS
jgi:hypothetical protein